MIPPSLLSVSGWFMAVPVWRLEPAVDAPPPPQQGAESDAPATAPGSAAPPLLCAQKWVFQGIEWRPAFFWDCLPNPAWSQWVESRDEAAQERTRRDDRLRRDALPPPAPKPAAVEGASASGPAPHRPEPREG